MSDGRAFHSLAVVGQKTCTCIYMYISCMFQLLSTPDPYCSVYIYISYNAHASDIVEQRLVAFASETSILH